MFEGILLVAICLIIGLIIGFIVTALIAGRQISRIQNAMLDEFDKIGLEFWED